MRKNLTNLKKNKMNNEKKIKIISWDTGVHKKIALFKSGYIKKDLTEIDPLFIQYFYSKKNAISHAKALNGFLNKNDEYYIVKVEKTIRGLKEIEGTEEHF